MQVFTSEFHFVRYFSRIPLYLDIAAHALYISWPFEFRMGGDVADREEFAIGDVRTYTSTGAHQEEATRENVFPTIVVPRTRSAGQQTRGHQTDQKIQAN